ncbi:unnamed protein product [Nippostrongylus brasiliensis]|uniref:Uncharacterized protein n=1 Tax=Nippostrongylus brasiliensis TaxID=27835 RepID=A0A0N4YV40_NIPBR|nr:unnamed protein product [Nippostrongylus brasiliensis]
MVHSRLLDLSGHRLDGRSESSELNGEESSEEVEEEEQLIRPSLFVDGNRVVVLFRCVDWEFVASNQCLYERIFSCEDRRIVGEVKKSCPVPAEADQNSLISPLLLFFHIDDAHPNR